MAGIFSITLVFSEKLSALIKSRNLILTSVIFIVGLSGIKITLGVIEFKSMGLATIVTMILGIAFIIFDKLGIMNEE